VKVDASHQHQRDLDPVVRLGRLRVESASTDFRTWSRRANWLLQPAHPHAYAFSVLLGHYPDVLVTEARHRRFYAFATACECPKAYLVQTEPDGAHVEAEGTPEAIMERYEGLPGEEIGLEGLKGIFTCKLIPSA
jgi:hypothetical protein